MLKYKTWRIVIHNPFNKDKQININLYAHVKTYHIDPNEISEEDWNKYGVMGTIIKRKLRKNRPFVKIALPLHLIIRQKFLFLYLIIKVFLIDLFKK